jgi:hypothetical protein
MNDLGRDIEIELESLPELILGALKAVDQRAFDDELVDFQLLDGDAVHLDPTLDDFDEAKVVNVVLHLSARKRKIEFGARIKTKQTKSLQSYLN